MLRRHRRPAHSKDRSRRDAVLGGLLLVVVLIAGYLSTVAIDGGPLSSPYTVHVVVPQGAPLLKDGDDVRIAGDRAGVVRGVRPATAREAAASVGGATLAGGSSSSSGSSSGGGTPSGAGDETASPSSAPRAGTYVTIALDDGPLGQDAQAAVRLRGVAGAVYVDLRPGDASRPLADGAILGTPAASATQLSDVATMFDATTRRAVRSTVQGLGGGLRGRGDELNHTLAALPSTLERSTPLARALTPTPGALSGLLGDASPVLRALDADGNLTDLAPALRRVVAAIPSAGLRDTVDGLPPAQDELRGVLPRADRLLTDTRATADGLRPVTAALDDALPRLNAALKGTRGIQAFRRLGASATPVLDDATPVLRDARDPAALVTPLATPLGPLSSYLAPYRRDIVEAVAGFNRWGDFAFQDGAASGARAVRFSLVLTCHRNRDPYPAPGEASKQRKACQ
jgi:ABC-type transporter Mla subunit MlaD